MDKETNQTVLRNKRIQAQKAKVNDKRRHPSNRRNSPIQSYVGSAACCWIDPTGVRRYSNH